MNSIFQHITINYLYILFITYYFSYIYNYELQTLYCIFKKLVMTNSLIFQISCKNLNYGLNYLINIIYFTEL